MFIPPQWVGEKVQALPMPFPSRKTTSPERGGCQKVSTPEDIRRATKARRRFILRRPLAYHAFLSETAVKTRGGEGENHLLSRLSYTWCAFNVSFQHTNFFLNVGYSRYSNACLINLFEKENFFEAIQIFQSFKKDIVSSIFLIYLNVFFEKEFQLRIFKKFNDSEGYFFLIRKINFRKILEVIILKIF